MDNKQYKRLDEHLSRISKLLGVIAIQGKSFREQVQLLSEAGLGPTDIARIIGKDVNTIKVTKSLMRRKKNG